MFGRVGARNDGGGKVCDFFLQGKCRFGSSCKFVHPTNAGPTSGGNRFSALSDQTNLTSNDRGRQTDPRGNRPLPFSISKDALIADMKGERPEWPFSCYSPGRDTPRQLIEGPLEQSMEEMRVLYYIAQASGNVQQAQQNELQLYEKANQQVQTIMNDVDGAINYVVNGENEHPNRLDLLKQNDAAASAKPSNPFSSAPTTGTAFGQPSAFGKPATPFGQASQAGSTGAFGQPSQLGGGSAFGQPSQVGRSAFGQPSQSGAPSAFGQPSRPGGNSAFGQPSQPGPSPFGQSSQPAGASAFGQPSQSGASSAFGQPSQPGASSAFGQPSLPGAASAFGQQSQPGASSAFGQPSQSSTGAFGQPPQSVAGAFGQPSLPGNGSSGAFGQPSAMGASQTPFGQQRASPSPFAAANTTAPGQAAPSPFAAAASQNPPSTGAFGQPSSVGAKPNPFASATSQPAFGQSSQPTSSPFATQTEAPKANPFSQPAQPNGPFNQQSQLTASPSPFAQPTQQAQPTTNGPTLAPGTGATATPDSSLYLNHSQNGTLQKFKNNPVFYIDNEPHYRRPGVGEERIWFPEGPPTQANKYTEETQEVYAALGAAVEDAYRHLAQTGAWKDGRVPDVAPMRAWVRFDV